MRCPKCDVEMMSFAFQGIEVDRCPQCDGVWLDKGELEAILERNLGDAIEMVSFATMPRVDDDAPATCHRCGEPMISLVGAADVRFEWCQRCEAIFFDKGELSIIQAFKAE